MRYNVIFLWRGERHHAGQYFTRREADLHVAEMRKERWNCWTEPVRFEESEEERP